MIYQFNCTVTLLLIRLAVLLDKMPRIRNLDEAKQHQVNVHKPCAVMFLSLTRKFKSVKRSEAEAADAVELRSMLNALNTI
jgi:hypothetical protein